MCTCLDHIELNFHSLSEDEQDRYRYCEARLPYRKPIPRFQHAGFHTNYPLISISRWKHAKRYSMCGTPGADGRFLSRCNQYHLCDLCAAKKSAAVYSRYKDSFHKAPHWYAITYSFQSNVFISDSPDAKDSFLSRWREADSYVKGLLSEGLIQGAFAVRELSINSISGLALFPHTHIVVNSDRDDLQYHPAAHSLDPNVSIRIQKIPDELSLIREVSYPIKPINLLSIYGEEFPVTHPGVLQSNLSTVLNKYSEYSHKVLKVLYYGNMDARRKKSYIGTRMSRRASQGSSIPQDDLAEAFFKAMFPKNLIQDFFESTLPKYSAALTPEPDLNTLSNMQPRPPQQQFQLQPRPPMPQMQPVPQQKPKFSLRKALGYGATALGAGALGYAAYKGGKEYILPKLQDMRDDYLQNQEVGHRKLVNTVRAIQQTQDPSYHGGALNNTVGGRAGVSAASSVYPQDILEDTAANSLPLEDFLNSQKGRYMDKAMGGYNPHDDAIRDIQGAGGMGQMAQLGTKLLTKNKYLRGAGTVLGRGGQGAMAGGSAYDIASNPLNNTSIPGADAGYTQYGADEVSPYGERSLKDVLTSIPGALSLPLTALSSIPTGPGFFGEAASLGGGELLRGTEDAVRNYAGKTMATGDLGDYMLSLYRGAKAGDARSLHALRQATKELEASPEWMSRVNEGVNADRFNLLTGREKTTLPAVQHLHRKVQDLLQNWRDNPDTVQKQGAEAVTWVPTEDMDSVQRHGLLSSEALLKNPEVLARVARHRGLTVEEQTKQIQDRLKSWHSPSSRGVNALFQLPPEGLELSEKHPVRQTASTALKIDLDKLLQDYPDTVIHGHELVPLRERDRKKHGDAYIPMRHRDLSPEDFDLIASQEASRLWKHYNPKSDLYAADVPHMSIRTPDGRIDPKYFQAV